MGRLELLHDGVVRVERDGHLLVITLNRPDARNAVNAEVTAALGAAVELLAADDDLRVGILTGAGTAFCAGQDLKAFAAGEPVLPVDHPEWGFGGFTGHAIDKPLIAAVNGVAFGGGLELALACDIVLAADHIALGLPEVKRGLFAAGGGVPRLAQQLPPKVAARLVFTGDPFTAEQAAQWGLVDEVVPADAVLEHALDLAARIAANAPLGVQASKRALTALGQQSSWTPDADRLIRAEFDAVFGSADAAEGSRAFVEKREPRWAGR